MNGRVDFFSFFSVYLSGGEHVMPIRVYMDKKTHCRHVRNGDGHTPISEPQLGSKVERTKKVSADADGTIAAIDEAIRKGKP